jgi:hypothetical protein
MRSRQVATAALVVSALGTMAVATAVAVERAERPAPAASEELAREGVRWHGNDLGIGEHVLLVVGGAFDSRAVAEQENRRIAFGDVHGYYVAATDQFVGLRDVLGTAAADHVLVTAFRTAEGAADFLGLARAVDAPALLTPRLQNLGFEYVGLGQEPHPDGSGPLIGPLPGVSAP